ncbi:MAG: biotin/lipoyl-containing protein [Candidatus Merdivicinus sp.]|jgi:biotin carboxyl carrier protein
MRRFNITVNGKAYDVAVEEVGGVAPVAVAPAAAPAAPAAPAPAPAAAPAGPVSGTEMKAPMPGTIMDVKVSVGSSVEKAQVVLIMEAMKMENEIVAPVAGKVLDIRVKKGDSVNAGDVLAVIG